MRYTLTLRQDHFEAIKTYLIQPDGIERIAFILCGRAFIQSDPWDICPEERFLSQKVVYLPASEIIESTHRGVTWKTVFLLKLLKEAEQENQAIAIVHNHPEEIGNFSLIDNLHEPELFKLIFNRNGGNRLHASLIITPSGKLFGRIFNSQIKSYPIDFIRILGDSFKYLYEKCEMGLTEDAFHRQALLFGPALNQDLFHLRIGIIGCGGTGSATAILLARLGVGKILLVDRDYVDMTNLNRLYGASKKDAQSKRFKVDVLASCIEDMGLGTKVITFAEWADFEKAQDYLKSCDIIFGCTDDHLGRSLLNRLAYFYLIPVIDMGLIIDPIRTESPGIRSLDGRCTVLFPRSACLLCRSIIDPKKAAEEGLKRSNPIEYERQKQEAYVIGEGNPNPAVITFTTEVATMAVNELIHRLQGFRGHDGSAWEWRRLFLKSEIRKTGSKIREGCEVCGSEKYWGRGDMNPFLNRI